MTLTSFSRSHQHYKIFKVWPRKLVCTLYLEPNDGFWPNFVYCKFVTLGWFKDLIRFWWSWPNFQGHHTIKTVKFSNFDEKSLCAPYLLNQMMDSGQTSSYIVMLGWFKDWIRCWWPWPNFQGHQTIKTVKWALSALYLLNQLVDFDQPWTETPLWHGKEIIKFWWPYLIFKVTPALCQILTNKSLSAPYLLNQIMYSGKTLCIVSLDN